MHTCVQLCVCVCMHVQACARTRARTHARVRVRVRVRALRRSKAQHRLANLAAAQRSVVQGRAAETRKRRRLAAEEAGGQGSCSAGIAVPKSAASFGKSCCSAAI